MDSYFYSYLIFTMYFTACSSCWFSHYLIFYRTLYFSSNYLVFTFIRSCDCCLLHIYDLSRLCVYSYLQFSGISWFSHCFWLLMYSTYNISLFSIYYVVDMSISCSFNYYELFCHVSWIYYLLLSLIVYLILLLSLSLVTVLERKMISAISLRYGPRTVINTYLQPVIDGVKLLCNELVIVLSSTYFIVLALLSAILINTTLWWTIPDVVLTCYLCFLIILTAIGCMVYTALVISWSSNGKYSRLASIRSIVASLSYELIFTAVILVVVLLFHAITWSYLLVAGSGILPYCLCAIVRLYYITSTISECNRAPFDFMESESELIAGMLTELSSLIFAIYYLLEVILLLSLSLIGILLFSHITFIVVILLSLLLLRIVSYRRYVVRIRYDRAIQMYWVTMLPRIIFNLISCAYRVSV